MSLRDQVDRLLPGWMQWYPSLFDAAADLGLIRARVCPPGSLLLSRRHADIRARSGGNASRTLGRRSEGRARRVLMAEISAAERRVADATWQSDELPLR